MKIALSSTGPMSGKSTLARALRNIHGYCIADHALTLVKDLVRYINREDEPGTHFRLVTIEEILENKDRWRKRLQEHSRTIGYSSTERAKYWTLETLETCEGANKVVFDPFRGEVQAQVMRDLGFTIVQLHISEKERAIRAGDKYDQVLAAMSARPDLELGIEKPDYTIVSQGIEPDMLADLVYNWVTFDKLQ